MPADAGSAAAALARELAAIRARVAGILVYRAEGKGSDDAWLAPVRAALGGAPVAVGTDDGFVQINRNRPSGTAFDAVCYSINPQVHAIDNLTLVENLEAQADTIETARSFAAGKEIWVSPVTLKMRYNPNAKNPNAAVPAGQLPPNVDPRQMSLFGAGWTLGSLKFLAQSGAQRVTYYETTGWRGVLDTAGGSSLPDLFPKLPGAAYPLYHVFADVAGFGGRVLTCESDDPLSVEGLVLRSGSRTRVLIANLSHELRPVRITGIGAEGPGRRLNATNANQAMTRPEEYRQQVRRLGPDFVLEPYELLRIDV